MKKGFTLAEVLITLGVIGVVSAITIPTLIQNYQKHVTVNQLKKAYSEFAQIIQKDENEYGLLETWDFENFETSFDRNKYFAENYLFPHINTIKRCIPTSNECWADNILNSAGNERSDNTYVSNEQDGAISYITSSGQSVFIWLHANGTGVWFWIDLNGKDKGPNKMGRDIFAFMTNWGKTSYKQGVFPAGAHGNYTKENIISGQGLDNNAYACKKDSSTNNRGGYCSALIMLDGWKIDKDYPW